MGTAPLRRDVIPRESGESSTPRPLRIPHDGLWNTGSPAFAGDDSCGRDDGMANHSHTCTATKIFQIFLRGQ
ncbi:hypothetical protein C7U92_24060 [Bradyrhizobium sp. WBOS7]|uniref:Uncharacterized protein n=1 Tax=Bradyrhizobium betae TaxID=244734 RepID=A0AAE9SRJ4_9BRAD|nr:hypothetical protein [Bradyrhizobium sp. WBOS2]MDD1573905.1 hypothetical protein [Bradyrhizobium sp. WBOS1]MDD1579776.1 hypothetical protein [Bradyrhizobium sp. WBOS7]MDD1602949.1 hypothetical protein [Bradyrhizobium sp. WBOS16]UUO34308.1 hypothetical protein DCK84_06785 [Bradyrhizobium sp. WBOS01]UUO40739.1 hypothetical protein DCM75_08210 [Bradyrhizobium sp. WBOS02]UUO52837.1 hypothetical protein DCM79_07480 [Bradyrhizobium sp. WBOS07]UUO65008.1 hypothetical protein DCM83_07105 [Bradyrh